MEQNQKAKYNYMSSLKGIACLVVVFEHFASLLRFAEYFPSFPLLERVVSSRLNYLIDGRIWIYLFFIISGYLVSKSSITSVKQMISKIISRFLRFAIPVLFVYAVIYLLNISIGFHASETSEIFQNRWFQKYYIDGVSLLDVVLSPVNVLILKNTELNAPYWVLNEMLIASVLIYLINYFRHRLSDALGKQVQFLLLAVLSFSVFIKSAVVGACLIGMMFSIFDIDDNDLKPYYISTVIIAIMFGRILPENFPATLFFGLLVVAVPNIKPLYKLLSIKPLVFLGNISWGIYSFHWPLFCSVGAITIIRITVSNGFTESCIVSLFAVLISTLLLSIGYYYTFEKLSTLLLSKINSVLKKFC